MNKRNRNIIIICSLILVLSIVILIIVCTKKNNNLEKNNVENTHQETYTMYVKINPIVKLTFKKVKYECMNDNTPCYSVESEITDYELINDDAKEIYKDLDFLGKHIEDALIMLCEVARDNNIGFKNLEITTDSKDYTKEYISQEINKNLESDNLFNVIINFQEHINEKEVLKEYEIIPEQNVEYTITFDSDGGTKIENQVVSTNALVKEPLKPIKDGYTFIEWQLNNKKYDFNTKVNQDFVLKAKWQKNTEEITTTTAHQTTTVPKPTTTTTNKPQTTTVPKEENKITSTINKINLNENILMDEYVGVGTMCTYYVFSTNIIDIMPEGSIKNKSIAFNEVPGFEKLMEEVIYDIEKEQIAMNKLNSLDIPRGIINFSAFNSNHHIGYRLDRLNITSGQHLEPFSTEYTNRQIAFEKQIKSIFSEAYLISGGCGTGPTEVLLNEQKCNQYNLICDRW